MRNAVILQEAEDGFKEMDRILWQVLTACTIPRDENPFRNPARPGFKVAGTHGQPLRPDDWCGQVSCILASDTSSDPEYVNIHKDPRMPGT